MLASRPVDVLTLSAGPTGRAGRAGPGPAPSAAPAPASPCATSRAWSSRRRAAADRLGQRRRPRPPRAAVLPAGPVRRPACSTVRPAPRRAASSSTGRTSPPTSRRATYRLLEWRQRRYATEAWGSISGVALSHSTVVAEIRALHRRARADDREPGARAATRPTTPAPASEWGWNWTVAKRALEFLFFTGEVTSARRNAAFERLYDLTERVLPPEVLAAPPVAEDDAVRALVEISARAHGVGDAALPRRLLPAAPGPDPARGRRARRGRRPAAGDRARLGPTRLPAPRRAPAPPATGRDAAQPVRPAGVRAPTARGAVRHALPDRDLRQGAGPRARLLRAAVPARRAARGAGRPQGRPVGARAARARRVRRARGAGAPPPRRSPRSCGRWPAGSAWTTSSCAAPARGDLAAGAGRGPAVGVGPATAVGRRERRRRRPG